MTADAQKQIIGKKTIGVKDAVLVSFTHVMSEKGYGSITVQDLLKRAQIGRTTFYAHFTSKEDVLKASVDQLRDSLLAAVKADSIPHKMSPKSPRLKFTVHFFNHILSHHKLYDGIVGRDEFFIVERYFFRMLVDLVGRELVAIQNPNGSSIKLELTIQHLVGAIWSTSIWALERKHLSASDIDEHFQRMTFGGLERTLKHE
jgi:AcrR family transcriptional regulator